MELKKTNEIRILKFVKNEFLTDTVKVGVKSVFSNGLGSTFSKGPYLGPGLFYKVCRLKNMRI